MPETARRPDLRFDRAPKVRHGMILIIPNPSATAADRRGRLSVTETAIGGRVAVDDGGGIERGLSLNVRELRALSDACNRVARRVARREEPTP